MTVQTSGQRMYTIHSPIGLLKEKPAKDLKVAIPMKKEILKTARHTMRRSCVMTIRVNHRGRELMAPSDTPIVKAVSRPLQTGNRRNR